MADKPTMVVTDESFAETVLASDKPVLVDFWASWCGPCKMVAPVLDEIAVEHDEITVAKLDVDANPGTAQNYRIMSLPTMILFAKGEAVKQIIGAKSKAALLADLADYV